MSPRAAGAASVTTVWSCVTAVAQPRAVCVTAGGAPRARYRTASCGGTWLLPVRVVSVISPRWDLSTVTKAAAPSPRLCLSEPRSAPRVSERGRTLTSYVDPN